MDPMLLAMLGSIGLQFFTNNKNNQKARELQEAQKEYQRVALNKQLDRMRQLQIDQARLSMELEEEVHFERMAEIEKEYDEVLDKLIDNIALQNWPLNVLPFIMRGESYGSLIRGGSKTIAIHCILTPSNCSNFNKQVYQELDSRLEAEMNERWNTQTTHPVVYYGGAWKRTNTSEDDLFTDIQLLKTHLKSVPCMIITPYFKDENGVLFRIHLWGMGDSTSDFTICPPEGFMSYEDSYRKGLNYGYTDEYGDDLFNVTLEEFIAYIESLIGLVADKYFWSIYKELPILPHIIHSKKLINQTYNVYEGMLLDYVENSFFNVIKAIDFYNQCNSKDNLRLNFILSKYFNNHGKTWDKNISIYKNYVNNKISVTDVVLINKLCLCGLLTSEEASDLISKTTSDNLIVVYSINELLDQLSNDYGMYDFYDFKVINNKVCVGFLTSKILPTRSVVAILYSEINISHSSYEYDLNKKSIFAADNEFSQVLNLIPKAIFELSDRSEIKKQSIHIKDKIQLGIDIYNQNPSILLNSRTERLSFGDLMNWIKLRKKKGSHVQISQMIYQDHYYLVLVLLDHTKEVVETEAFKMFSIDSKVSKKLDNNLILTINL